MNSSRGERVRRRSGALAAMALVVVLLSACGSGGGQQGTSGGKQGTASTTTARPRPNQHPLTRAAQSIARRWCAVRLGSASAAVKAAMGKPHGNDAQKHPDLMPRGTQSLEWDSAPFVFVASFKADRATTLQAYNLAVGPIIGAYGLKCPAFRQG
jgi:hypothetical protein